MKSVGSLLLLSVVASVFLFHTVDADGYGGGHGGIRSISRRLLYIFKKYMTIFDRERMLQGTKISFVISVGLVLIGKS